MKLKIYDSGKKYEGSVERYTLYYPFPQWMKAMYRTKHRYIKAYCWGFSYNINEVITACHFDDNYNLDLGKRIPIEAFPEHVVKWILKEEDNWNKSLKKEKELCKNSM